MKTQIIGDDMQAVIAEFKPGEEIVAEAGGMMYMRGDISIDSEMRGGLLKGVMRSVFGGESLFLSVFRCGQNPGEVGFAAPYPGQIEELKLDGNKVIAQRDAFMFSHGEIEIGVELSKKLGAGFFGGEGFILQNIQGTGSAFIHAGGNFVSKELAENEVIKVDTGCLVAFDEGVEYNIERIGGIKTSIFGGEGLFIATLKGPGRVWLQTLPFSRMANKIYAAAGANQGQSRGAAGLGGDLLQGFISGD